jgi:Rrf2 family protein
MSGTGIMKLSTKSRYGLRILLQIAAEADKLSAIKGKDIAQKQEISEAYLEQIMIPLKNSGIIRTVRGCNGGYGLNRSPEKITVLDIIELFEGKLQLVKCVSDSSLCERCNICLASEVWERLSDVLRREAAQISLTSLVEKMKKNYKLEYVI